MKIQYKIQEIDKIARFSIVKHLNPYSISELTPNGSSSTKVDLCSQSDLYFYVINMIMS